MYNRTKVILPIVWALLAPISGLCVEGTVKLAPAARSEISHLLDYIEKSGCEFYRNGIWYEDTEAVREHVERKYRYFGKRDQISSAEDFITWAGTKSELSGEPYAVRCENSASLPMSQWLKEELQRYRQKKADRARQTFLSRHIPHTRRRRHGRLFMGRRTSRMKPVEIFRKL